MEGPFLDLLKALTERLSDAGVPLRGNPYAVFRMNRDMRFTEDKSPYRTSISAVLTPSGTKEEDGGLLYVQMDRKGLRGEGLARAVDQGAETCPHSDGRQDG